MTIHDATAVRLQKDATDSPAPYRHQLPPGFPQQTKTDTATAAARASGFCTRAGIARDGDPFPGTGTKFSDQLEYDGVEYAALPVVRRVRNLLCPSVFNDHRQQPPRTRS
jgi:hypothetical protein